MIRKFKTDDLEQVMELWLATNISAHDFIPAKYWQDNYALVKEMRLKLRSGSMKREMSF